MTRFLSEALEAPEPFFRQGIRRLEAANNYPNTDIRLSIEVNQAAQNKLRELGLDPRDTAPKELYRSLQERLKVDEARLVKTLRREAAHNVSAEGRVVDGMVHVLSNLADKQTFALKNGKLRAVLKAVPPKKAMKRLGYRSLESCLKHENPIMIMAAAWLTEGHHWQRRVLEQYKRLKPNDFEDRPIAVMQAEFSRWPDLAQAVADDYKHNLLCFKELGALVLLPLPKQVPTGVVTASLSLALHELNQIGASSTFLKLNQVKPDFGKIVQTVAVDEPRLVSEHLDQSVPWHLIQRYYSRLSDQFNHGIFEPHINLDDMVWQPIEESLSKIEPSLAFWKGSHHLSMVHGRRPVSFNIIDVALNHCNGLSFEHRLSHYFQHSLWHELLLRYLRPESVEQSVIKEMQPALEMATV
jgi:hypothetical protein